MKGIGPLIVAVIALIMLITIITGGYLFLAGKSATIQRTARDTAIINGINYMELLKDSLAQSLAYSSYQAFYNISANGGYIEIPPTVKSSNSIPYWSIYGDTSGYPQLWGPDTEKLILNYLNKYVKALASGVDRLTIPDYQIHLVCSSNDCTVDASSQTQLKFDSLYGFILSDKASMSKLIDTQFHSLFDQATASYYTKDSVKNAIVDARDSTTKDSLTKNSPECIHQTISYCETPPQVVEQPPSCESVYPTSCPTKFKNFITQNLLSLQSPENLPTSSLSTETLVNPVDIEVAHTTTDTVQSVVQDPSCGCAQTGQDAKGATICVHYYQRIKISCTYNNYGAVKVLITMTDTQNKYPVYDSNDKTTDMRFTKLQFYVISGSDNSDQTKNLITP